MRESVENPKTNALGTGVTEDAVLEAVRRSGYPLQAGVVRTIERALSGSGSEPERSCFVQEEWAFEDPDSGEIRALDALAELSLWDPAEVQPRIRPTLSLLVECKQSELPFVFFTRPQLGRAIADYPDLAGFPHDYVALRTDDDPSAHTFSLRQLWSLMYDPFVLQPPVAVSMSRARRKGNDLEVTGEDTYKGLVLPLRKGVQHLQSISRHEGKHYGDARIIASVAVVRAPMISVPEDGSGGLEAVPWVRVHRHEPIRSAPSWKTHELTAFDVVHEDYLIEYLNIFTAYAGRAARGILSSQKPLLDGRGFASGLGQGKWPNQIDAVDGEVRRIAVRLGAESIWAHLTGRVPPFGEYVRTPLHRRRK